MALWCDNLLTAEDFRRAARRRLPRLFFDYIDGAAGDEITARRNADAFAEIAHLHRASPFGIWRGETRRAVIWAAMAPIAFFLALAVTPWAAFGLGIYPLQLARLYLAARARLGGDAAPWALFTVLGKFPEAVGVLRCHWGRLMGRRAGLLEYK